MQRTARLYKLSSINFERLFFGGGGFVISFYINYYTENKKIPAKSILFARAVQKVTAS